MTSAADSTRAQKRKKSDEPWRLRLALMPPFVALTLVPDLFGLHPLRAIAGALLIAFMEATMLVLWPACIALAVVGNHAHATKFMGVLSRAFNAVENFIMKVTP